MHSQRKLGERSLLASLILSAYNEGPLLTRTLSACTETIGDLDYEVIIADDASTDRSTEMLAEEFPMARIERHPVRRGASPTKVLGARQARGDVLVFLDGHCKPEHGAIERMVSTVRMLDGEAIVTPAIAALDPVSWRNAPNQIGHGYRFNLSTLRCAWEPMEAMAQAGEAGGLTLYESPALIGCAFAVSRELYERLWGFDAHMRSWGVEDLDLSLKCWLMGSRVLHNPEAVVGHRFQDSFTQSVSPADVTTNELRLARKNFTETVWSAWVEARRSATPGALDGAVEGVWARAWHMFESDRASVEQERRHLMARRPRDEFWYAERFGLKWPRVVESPMEPAAVAMTVHSSVGPSVSPSPPPTPTVEIQVNNTPVVTDDVVRLFDLHPPQRVLVNCQIRLVGVSAAPVTVVLNDPSGHLNFPSPGVTTRTLSLPADGSFVPFQISGDAPSAAVRDASIVAHVGSVGGPVCGSTAVTVASFDSAQITLTQGANYGFAANSYSALGGPAVLFAAQVRLRPAGVNCAAPQLSVLRVGIMQEASNVMITQAWDTPTIVWLAATPSGATVNVPGTMTQTGQFQAAVTQPVNDGVDGAAPLYERGAGALLTPLGCTGGGVAQSSDNPSSPAPPTFVLPVQDASGTVVGTVTWTRLVYITFVAQFRTFCVTFNPATNSFCNQRQATWTVNLDSRNASQHAVVTPDAAPTATPASGVQANHALAFTSAGAGAAVTFTKP